MKLTADFVMQNAATWLGVEIRESPLAVQRVPKRVHRHRRTQTLRYHQRIQKKWARRWGYEHKPSAYVINTAYLTGHGRPVLVCHPEVAKKLKAALAAG